MAETRLLSLWDGLVGSAALIAIIILALCVMVRAVKLGDALRQLGVIAGRRNPADHAARDHYFSVELDDLGAASHIHLCCSHPIDERNYAAPSIKTMYNFTGIIRGSCFVLSHVGEVCLPEYRNE